jgi:hypothetical protein
MKALKNAEISVRLESYKLYYVNFEESQRIGLERHQPALGVSPGNSYCFSVGFLTDFCRVISYWMYCSRRCGSAPTSFRPLTKIVGVLLTSSFCAFSRLASIAAAGSGLAMQARKESALSPACPAYSVIFVQAFSAEMSS